MSGVCARVAVCVHGVRVHTCMCACVYAHVCSPYVHGHACACVWTCMCFVHTCARVWCRGGSLVAEDLPFQPGQAGPKPCAEQRGPGRWPRPRLGAGPSPSPWAFPRAQRTLNVVCPSPPGGSHWMGLCEAGATQDEPLPASLGVRGERQGGRSARRAVIRADNMASPWPGLFDHNGRGHCVFGGTEPRPFHGGWLHFLWFTVYGSTTVATSLRPQDAPKQPLRGPGGAAGHVPEETGCWARGGWGVPGLLWACEQQEGWGVLWPLCLRGPRCCCFSIKPDLTELGSCAFLRGPLGTSPGKAAFLEMLLGGWGRCWVTLGGEAAGPVLAAPARAPPQARASSCPRGASKG